MTPRARLPWAVFPLAALALVATCAWIRPNPFTSGDGILRYLPLIKAHTDSLLAGAPLRMLWGLGAGWNPLQSGEMGLGYLPYHAANLGARILGRPLALLEVSAWMHLAAAPLVGWHLLPATVEGRERWAACLLLMVLPGPFLLGLNWASYLAAYPWFLALALLAARPCPRPGARARALFACAAGFYLAAHVQMFALGCLALLLALPARALGPRDAPGLKALLVALVPFAVPLAYVKWTSLQASPGWQQVWASRDLLVQGAQPLPVALGGLAAGNLAPLTGFRTFGEVSWLGVGVFFAPWLLAVAVDAARDRRWGALALWVGLALLLGARSVPLLSFLSVGPLEGFRWTWKLMLLAGPLSLAAWLASPTWRNLGPSWREGLAWTAAAAALAVCLRGLPFVLSRGAADFTPLGAERMVRNSREVLVQCGVQPGTRLAFLDLPSESPGLPVPFATLLGNGALLAGFESVHLFEPLDEAGAAAERLGLSSQQLLPPEFLVRPEAEAWLASRGVRALVAAAPLPGPGTRSALDALGRRTWVRPVGPARPWSYPWAYGPEPLERLPGGRLRSLAPSAQPPRAISVRALAWTRRADGTWEGRPEGLGAVWWAPGLGFLALAAAGSFALDRPRRGGPPSVPGAGPGTPDAPGGDPGPDPPAGPPGP